MTTGRKMFGREEYNKQRMRDFVRIVQNEQNIEACFDFFSPNFYNPDLERIMKSTSSTSTSSSSSLSSTSTSCFKNHVEGDKKLHRMLFKAFPDMEVTILDMAADGHKVWTYKRFVGTHTGPWMMDDGDADGHDIDIDIVQPTGQTVEFFVIDIMSFDDHGTILDHSCVETFTTVLGKLRLAKSRRTTTTSPQF